MNALQESSLLLFAFSLLMNGENSCRSCSFLELARVAPHSSLICLIRSDSSGSKMRISQNFSTEISPTSDLHPLYTFYSCFSLSLIESFKSMFFPSAFCCNHFKSGRSACFPPSISLEFWTLVLLPFLLLLLYWGCSWLSSHHHNHHPLHPHPHPPR